MIRRDCFARTLVALVGAVLLGGCGGEPGGSTAEDGANVETAGPQGEVRELVPAEDAGVRLPARTLLGAQRTNVAVNPIPPVCAECPGPPTSAGPQY